MDQCPESKGPFLKYINISYPPSGMQNADIHKSVEPTTNAVPSACSDNPFE